MFEIEAEYWCNLAAVLDEFEDIVEVTMDQATIVARDVRGSEKPIPARDRPTLEGLIDYFGHLSERDDGPLEEGPASRILRGNLTFAVLSPPMTTRRILKVRRWPAARSWRFAIEVLQG